MRPIVMRFLSLAAGLVAGIALAQCGSGPVAPKDTPTVFNIVLNGPSIAAGATGQGTVTLTAAAPASGATVALSSSNTAVATVETPVTIQAGSSSTTFTIAAVSTGTATITASANGSSAQSPLLTVTAGSALSSISLSASSVVGGAVVTGTATLTAPAPAGGAVVSLSASDPITVPSSVTVPAGSASATFGIATRLVGGTITRTISGSYGGGSASAVLSVTKPTVATASFGVTGPSQTDTCTLTSDGQTLKCTFDGATSSAPGTIVAWDWSFTVATTFAQTTSGPLLTMPAINCSLVPSPPLPPDTSWFKMSVTLKIHDDVGNTAEATNSNVRLFPQGACGF